MEPRDTSSDSTVDALIDSFRLVDGWIALDETNACRCSLSRWCLVGRLIVGCVDRRGNLGKQAPLRRLLLHGRMVLQFKSLDSVIVVAAAVLVVARDLNGRIAFVQQERPRSSHESNLASQEFAGD